MRDGRLKALWRYGPVVLALALLCGGYVYFYHWVRMASEDLLRLSTETQWTALRTELELHRLLDAAHRYARASAPIEREEVLERLDLLLSRLRLPNEGEHEPPALVTLLGRLEIELDAIQRLVRSEPRSPALGSAIDSRLEPLIERMHDMVLATLDAAGDRDAEDRARIDRLSRAHSPALLGTIAGMVMLVLVLLLLLEIIRTQRQLEQAAMAERRAAELAHQDVLTGLPNRRLFQDRLHHALAVVKRQGSRLALHLVDLDRFKDTNDRYGHAMGDALLRATAQRMQACLRAADTLARLGGDEFAIIQLDIDGPADVSALMERLRLAVRQPLEIAGTTLRPTASFGTALSPGDGSEADTLMRHADIALYRAKSDGRDRHTFYVTEMDREQRERRRLLASLGHAVEHGELMLEHQLRFAADGQPVAVEALVRWADPARGVVPPGEFLPLVEDTPLIVALGGWVVEAACQDCTVWRTVPGATRLRLSVNIAGTQLLRDDLLARIERALRRADLTPADLEIELPESAVVTWDASLAAPLDALRQRGVRVLLDHFGVGHSSIGALRELPIDGVKLAGALAREVHRPRGAALYEGMVRLAHGMGLSVVGGGVETAEQAATLWRLGCDELQGFYFAAPESAAALATRLASRQALQSIVEGLSD